MAKAVPSVRIFVEPIPRTFQHLCDNLALNNIANAIPLNLGLSDDDGELTFYFSPRNSVNASAAQLSESGDVEEGDVQGNYLRRICGTT